jgi:hypothetical protein
VFVTDGGLETTLVFDDGIELADFAAFPLLETGDGRAALGRYYATYCIAERLGLGMVVDTPTWRANPDWGARLGYDAAGSRAPTVRPSTSCAASPTATRCCRSGPGRRRALTMVELPVSTSAAGRTSA